MLETGRERKLGAIPEAIHEPVDALVGQLRQALESNLDSVTVVGSALTDDYQPGVSDINTVVVCKRDDLAVLRAVGSLGRTLRNRGFSAPLLMTPANIEQSRDVFGIELLDFQFTHGTVLGSDPFAALTFAKADVRLQCERELKATLSRLRQGYITSAGHPGAVAGISVAAVKGLAPLLRAMLWLRDIERPRTMQGAFLKSGDAFGVDLAAAVAISRQRHEKSLGDVEPSFQAIYAAVDRLAAIVDALEVA
jgi:hypothetical protein